MDTITSKGQSQSSCQQGYVLALTLILMLFASLILVSSIERTSVETRIAASELHRSTLEAAAEQGVHHFRRAVGLHIDFDKSTKKNCELIADLIAKEGLANLFDIEEKLKGPGSEQNPVDFLGEKDLLRAGWWTSLEGFDCSDDIKEYPYFEMVSHSKVISGKSSLANQRLLSYMQFKRLNDQRDPRLIDALGPYAKHTVAAGGSSVFREGSDFSGLIDFNIGSTVPTTTNYRSTIEDKLSNEYPEKVVKSCDLDAIERDSLASSVKYVFCDDKLTGDLKKDLDGFILVSSSGFEGDLKSDLSISIVTGGEVNIRKTESLSLKNGYIWSDGSVAIGNVGTSQSVTFSHFGLITRGALDIYGEGSAAAPININAEIEYDY